MARRTGSADRRPRCYRPGLSGDRPCRQRSCGARSWPRGAVDRRQTPTSPYDDHGYRRGFWSRTSCHHRRSHPVRVLREVGELLGPEPKRTTIGQWPCAAWTDYKAGRQPGQGPSCRGRMGGGACSRSAALLLHAGDVTPGKPSRRRRYGKEACGDHMACFEPPGGLRVRSSELGRAEA